MGVAETLCPGCFEEKGRAPACPRCGFDERRRPSGLALAMRTVLADQYVVGRVLGRPGGFGITYLGWDLRLETRVAIKEYLPRDIAGRDPDRRSIALHAAEDSANFQYGLEQFLQEARTLAKFNHSRVVRVRTFFEEHGTAYLVMDYVDGISLGEHLERCGGKLSEAQALAIMMPVLDGLREVHRRGFLHRDIKPQNIYITADGSPILLDFGAARLALGERSRSLSVVLTPGFAPYEQYHRRGEQGPWTDIYACAATLYTLVTGCVPPDALEREKGDSMAPPQTVRQELSPVFSAALVRAMSTDPRRRPSSVEEFQGLLLGRGAFEPESLAETVAVTQPAGTAGAKASPPATAEQAPTIAVPRGRRILGLPRAAAAALLAAVLILAAAGTAIFLGIHPGADESGKDASTALEGGAPASIPTHPEQAGAPPPEGSVEQTPVSAASESTGGQASVPPKAGQSPASGKGAPPPAGIQTTTTGTIVPPAGTGASAVPSSGAASPSSGPDQAVGSVALGEARPAPLEISEPELRAKCTFAVRPVYPPFLARSGVRGIVKVRVTLDETGRVAEVKPVEGNPLLTRLSEDAIRKCTFAPTLVDGKPVPVTGILTIAFPPRRQP